MKINHIIQKTQKDMRAAIGSYQVANKVPNFVMQMALESILSEIKDLRMEELILEEEPTESKKEG